MSDQALLSVLAAIALIFQAQAGLNLAPVIRPLPGMSIEPLCTGVDLSVGCVPAELALEP